MKRPEMTGSGLLGSVSPTLALRPSPCAEKLERPSFISFNCLNNFHTNTKADTVHYQKKQETQIHEELVAWLPMEQKLYVQIWYSG